MCLAAELRKASLPFCLGGGCWGYLRKPRENLRVGWSSHSCLFSRRGSGANRLRPRDKMMLLAYARVCGAAALYLVGVLAALCSRGFAGSASRKPQSRVKAGGRLRCRCQPRLKNGNFHFAFGSLPPSTFIQWKLKLSNKRYRKV